MRKTFAPFPSAKPDQAHQKMKIILCILALIALSIQAADKPLKPNILIIFTDDQGYADLACYGNKKNKTPRLDQLAKEGTRFTSFYSQTVCGPSRSALLTGRYPCRSKGWGMPASEVTFGELMRKSGYQTACIGKWDVSNRKAIINRMPNAQGFDYYFGALGANDGGGVGFHENNEKAGSSRDMGELTTLYTDKSIEYLKEAGSQEAFCSLSGSYHDAHHHRCIRPFSGQVEGWSLRGRGGGI